MKEIDSNKKAWAKIAKDHYHAFYPRLQAGTYRLNPYIERELGNLLGKKIIHLQCNTGADTIVLARKGARVTGVDLVPENIVYARKMAAELGETNVSFLESDIMTLSQIHHEKYDLVFTSEGVLGWLPDLNVWAKTVRRLVQDEGFLYVFDSHPFFLAMDESKLAKQIYEIKYPYFGTEPDIDDTIGGYATKAKDGVQAYFWMHTVGDIINALASAGMHVEYFHEYTENFYDSGGMLYSAPKGMFEYPYNKDRFPMSFSLKASVYRPKKSK